MIILSLRTDKPEAEIGLYDNESQIAYETWHAHRALAETLHGKINELLMKNEHDWSKIQGLAVYEGPGSFTGLRIGLSVANALAYSLNVPIAGATGEEWLSQATKKLLAGKGERQVMPEYGAPVHTTQQKK